MNDEIVVVSAFFDIGREDFKRNPRTREKYLEYFRHWARLRNRLMVYTDTRTGEYVRSVRAEFGLADRTEVVVVDDFGAIDALRLDAMKRVAAQPLFRDFRVISGAPSNDPTYSYLMYLKSWFIADAAKRLPTECLLAWIDFGFDHGGTVYPKSTDFDFEWRFPFDGRVHFFVVGDGCQRLPVFEVVRRMSDCFMGAPFVVPRDAAEFLLAAMREALDTLLQVGFIDDDQLLMLMAYRSAPERFEVHRSDWFLPIYEYGGSHMRVRVKPLETALRRHVRLLVRGARLRRRALGNAARLYRNLLSQ